MTHKGIEMTQREEFVDWLNGETIFNAIDVNGVMYVPSSIVEIAFNAGQAARIHSPASVERVEWWKKQYRKLYEGGAEKLAELGVIVDDVETHMKSIHYMESGAIQRKDRELEKIKTEACVKACSWTDDFKGKE